MTTTEPPAYQHIRCELIANVLTITLHRPDKLNAYTPQMGMELLDVFEWADTDDRVRALVITGSGRAFCAGAELGGGERFRYDNDGPHEDPGGRLTLRMLDLLKPVIVAFNGPAIGVGATMPLAADIRIASEDAVFSFPFTRLGIVPEAASAWFLPAIVGLPQALEWTLTGGRIQAREALEAKLVRSLHPRGNLLEIAIGIAQEISENTSAVSVALTRQMMWRLARLPDPRLAHQVSSAGMKARGAAGDAREGIAAFLEKRRARFPDRVPDDLPDFYPWWSKAPFESL